jgi:serine protease Do
MIRPQRRATHALWPLRDQYRAAAIAVLLLLAACTAAPYHADARPAPDSFAPLVKRVLPAVVNIAVTQTVTGNDVAAELPPELRDTPLGREFRRRFGNHHEQMMGAGSGFIIDPSGIIVTNNHVVDHADKIIVSLADGRQFPAHVLGTDGPTDVAVIKIDSPARLASVPWGDSRGVEVGDWILAAGNPFGLGGSVTAGIVSAQGRDLGSSPFDDFLQLDAPINPGNSGGPIFNMDGQVIGVSTAIVSPSGGSVGIGFAIPAMTVSNVVNELLAHGSIARGWLGVSVQDAPSGGVLIAGVEHDGPALRAGVHAGDMVVAVNGDHIDNARSLIRAVAAMPPGQYVRLTVRRQGHDMELPITIGRRPAEMSE